MKLQIVLSSETSLSDFKFEVLKFLFAELKILYLKLEFILQMF